MPGRDQGGQRESVVDSAIFVDGDVLPVDADETAVQEDTTAGGTGQEPAVELEDSDALLEADGPDPDAVDTGGLPVEGDLGDRLAAEDPVGADLVEGERRESHHGREIDAEVDEPRLRPENGDVESVERRRRQDGGAIRSGDGDAAGVAEAGLETLDVAVGDDVTAVDQRSVAQADAVQTVYFDAQDNRQRQDIGGSGRASCGHSGRDGRLTRGLGRLRLLAAGSERHHDKQPEEDAAVLRA